MQRKQDEVGGEQLGPGEPGEVDQPEVQRRQQQSQPGRPAAIAVAHQEVKRSGKEPVEPGGGDLVTEVLVAGHRQHEAADGVEQRRP